MENGMRKVTIGLLAALAMLPAACSNIPPTVVMMIVTGTPDPRMVQVTITPTSAATIPQATVAGTVTQIAIGSVIGSQNVTPSPRPTVTPAPTATFGPTQTLSPFPTETRAQLYIAQEDFQNGYMFWISSQKVIWVLYKSADNPTKGTWQSFQDTFVDGEPEIDPSLTPPPGLFQPKRGFGKLWRNVPGLKDKMGWATTPEFDLKTRYVYQPGGYLDSNNKYVPRPGKHFIESLSRQTFALSETDVPGALGTWEQVG
jgi:hypothetical protein